MDVNNIPPRTTNRIIFITLNVLLSSHINNGMMNPVMVAPIIVSIMPILNFLFMIRFALLYMLSSKLTKDDPKFEKMYDIEPLDETEYGYTIDAQKKWEKHIKEILWSEFERCMGNPNIQSMLDFSSSILEDLNSL